MRPAHALPAALALVTVAACATLGPYLPTGPWLTDSIRVPHDTHARADVDCLACHETVYDATDLSARHMPKEAVCLQCHAEQKDTGNCRFCHTEPRAAQTWPTPKPTIAFDHVTHLERTHEECVRCHTPSLLPQPLKREAAGVAMDTCLGCHEHRVEYQEGRCDRCHLDLPSEQLVPVKDFSHQGNFVVGHRNVARTTADSCMACHTQAQCVACHNATPPVRVEVQQPSAVDRNLIHRNDFVSRHSMEAQADPAQCYRCHTTDTCVACHRQQNLTPDGNDPRNPHPRGYVQRGGAAFHGSEARMDIQRCASCHDQGQASNCVKCHQQGGVGGNPHPPSWNLDHGPQEIRTNGMCQYCHNQR